jgi:hypothetical protein
MWKKLKFLTTVHFETERFINHESVPLDEILDKGISLIFIEITYSFHNSIFWIIARRWFNWESKKMQTDFKNKVIRADIYTLLEELAPYAKITKTGIHENIKLTYEGKRFINPLGFTTAVLKEYGIWGGFIFGVVATLLSLFAFFGIQTW